MDDRWFGSAFQIPEATDENDLEAAILVLRAGTHIDKDEEEHVTSMDTISLSRTVFEIFHFKVFRVWPWPSTSEGHLVSNFLYHSKAHIWLPIWLLWTPYPYLVPLSRYSTSKFLGFYLDLSPLKVIWGQNLLYYSNGYIWLPIWLLWTPSLYLVPFSR